MRRLFFLLPILLLLTAGADASGRRRAVRAPAPQCSFSLSFSFGTAIPSTGLANGAIQVTASPSTCTSWSAYSLTDWVTVERSGASALVGVAPNPTTVPRSATLLIAGIRHELTQEGAPLIAPPADNNVLLNPGFDRDLSFWGWRDEFPNGPGSESWSTSDANGNAASGSIRLRNTRAEGAGGHTFQRLQCVAVEGGAVYDLGGKFFAPSTAGNAVFVVVEYTGDNCSTGPIAPQATSTRVRTPLTWQSETRNLRLTSETKSAFMVIGSLATSPGTFDLLIDDVFLRKR